MNESKKTVSVLTLLYRCGICGTTLKILEKLEYDFNRARDKSNDEECAATLEAFEAVVRP
jgi:hypothetical protein